MPPTGPDGGRADDCADRPRAVAPAAGACSFEQITRLHQLLEAATLDRDHVDLAATLERIAQAVCQTLGLRVIVVNLYRPEWDDFVAATVVGPPEVRAELAGAHLHASLDVPRRALPASRGDVIRNGEFDWDGFEGKRVPLPEAGTDDPEARHPSNEIFVPFEDAAGRLLGIFCVGDPVSGRWPSDAALDALVAVAKHAAWAVLAAQETAAARSHRDALEELLRVSAELTEDFDIDRILGTVCTGIRRALGSTASASTSPTPTKRCARGPPPGSSSAYRGPASSSASTSHAALRPAVRHRGLLPPSARGGAGALRAATRSLRLDLNGRGPHAWQQPLAARPARRIARASSDRPDLGRRARRPAVPARDRLAGAAPLREPDADRARVRRHSSSCATSPTTTR